MTEDVLLKDWMAAPSLSGNRYPDETLEILDALHYVSLSLQQSLVWYGVLPIFKDGRRATALAKPALARAPCCTQVAECKNAPRIVLIPELNAPQGC